MSKRAKRDRISTALASRVIDTYGNDCWLQLPGCTQVGTTTDHVQPVAAHGATVLPNLRRACKHCNSSRKARVISGIGATFTCVIGPPAGGKSTYVREHMRDGDIVLDFDTLTQTLAPALSDSHLIPSYLLPAVRSAWFAIYSSLTDISSPVHVWIIKGIPTTQAHPELWKEWVQLNYDIVVCDPGRDVVRRRLEQQHRVQQGEPMVKQWYRLGLTQSKIDELTASRRAYMSSIGVLYASTQSQSPSSGLSRPKW